MTPSPSTADGPLAGVRVIEFCNVAAGPYCGMLLADMGADVIKVEPKTGDTLRQWPPFGDGFSQNFASLNRNKRSIALDLKDEADNRIASELIESAQVVIENNRPGAMARLGLGYDRFAKSSPALVYCSLSAFGQAGPRATEGGFDLTLQALSGIMSVTGAEDGDPVKCGVPISDFATGLYGAFAIAALLSRVASGGPGGVIDISMLGASLGIAALQTSEYFGTLKDPRRLGASHPRNAPYQMYTASDGNFVLAAGNDRLWRAVCEVVGKPELPSDPRFTDTISRAAHQAELAEILNTVFATQTIACILSKLEAAQVPCGRINTYAEALVDPQVQFMNWVQPITLPNGFPTRTFGSPIRLDGTALPIRMPPPALDGHRDSILSGLALRGADRA